MRSSTFLAATVVSTCLCLSIGPVMARSHILAHNLVSDGGFESPADCYQTYVQGQSLGAWKVVAGSIDHGSPSCGLWTPSEGSYSIDLNGDDTGTISQTISTKPGVSYDAHFALAGNKTDAPATKGVDVLIGSKRIGHQSFQTDGSEFMGWMCPTIDFTAKSRKSLLTLASTVPQSAIGPAIDDVRVTPENRGVNVTRVVPQVLAQGVTGQKLSVFGSGFKPGSSVSFSNPAIVVTSSAFVNTDRLAITVKTLPSSVSNYSSVTVSDPSGISDTCGNSVWVQSTT